MHSLLSDVRYAVRALCKSPGFTAVALLTIMVTLGGVATVFTLVNSILLRPLAYPAADRLVSITQTHPGMPVAFDQVTEADFEDFRAENRSFEVLASYDQVATVTMDPNTDPYWVNLGEATPALMTLLGAETVLGQPFLDDDRGPGSGRQAVVDHAFWTTRMGARDDVVGQQLPIPWGRTHVDTTVVGVLAPTFVLPGAGPPSRPSIWITPDAAAEPDRRFPDVAVVGRLRPDVSLAAARTDINTIAERLARAYPETNAGRTTTLTLLVDVVVNRARTTLWVFLGAVGCVLLIGVVNLTSLQVVRNAVRAREMHIRAALGAGRWRLLRHAGLESLLLSLVGGALGLLAGWSGLRVVLATLPARMPRSEEIGLDLTVVLVVFGVSLATGLVSSLVPAWHVARPDLVTAVKDSGSATTLSVRRRRVHATLIAVETAVALVLLVTAGLLTHSFGRLFTADAGFDEARLWSVGVSLPLTYRSEEDQRQFWTNALASIEELPHVETAAVGSMSPLSGLSTRVGGVRPEGTELEPGYFRTLGIPIVRGRAMLDTDIAGAEPVVILNEVAAEALWPGADPIGRRIAGVGRDLLTVIGIVPDFKDRRLDEGVPLQLYTAAAQSRSSPSSTIMVRLRPDATGGPAAIDTVITALERRADVTMRSMSQLRWSLVAEERFRTGVLVLFALTSVCLVVVGIVGAVSYTVLQRRREIGLRLVLGATERDVIQLAVHGAVVAATVGLAAGLALSVGVTRILSSFLFEVTATDPVTFAGALVGLLAVAFLASVLPALRATRINPTEILRDV